MQIVLRGVAWVQTDPVLNGVSRKFTSGICGCAAAFPASVFMMYPRDPPTDPFLSR